MTSNPNNKSDAAPTENHPTTQRRSPLKWLIRLGLGGLLVVFLLNQREVAPQFWNALRNISLPTMLAAVGFYLFGQALCAWKWQMLLRARGTSVSFVDCFRFYLAGMFGNLFLPTNIGGDALRTALLRKRAPELGVSGAAASVLVERLTGFAALLVLALGALIWRRVFEHSTSSALEGRILFGTAFIFAILALLWAVSGRIKHPKVVAIRNAIGSYSQPETRGALGVAMLLSFAFQISQILLNIGLARAIGLALPTFVFWWLGPLLSLSGLLPLSIGGLGVREAAALALLQNSGFGVPGGQIVAWSLLWQATVWLSSLPGILFVRGNRTA